MDVNIPFEIQGLVLGFFFLLEFEVSGKEISAAASNSEKKLSKDALGSLGIIL